MNKTKQAKVVFWSCLVGVVFGCMAGWGRDLYVYNLSAPILEQDEWVPLTMQFPDDRTGLHLASASPDLSVAVSRGSPYPLSAARDSAIEIHFLEGGRVIKSIPLHEKEADIRSICLSRTGSAVAYVVEEEGQNFDIYAIYWRKQIEGMREFSPAQVIYRTQHPTLSPNIIGVSDDGETVLWCERRFGGSDAVVVMRDLSSGRFTPVQLLGGGEGGSITHSYNMSGNGNWAFFEVHRAPLGSDLEDDVTVYSHYDGESWSQIQTLIVDGEAGLDVDDCNTDATWLRSGTRIICRIGDEFRTVWSFERSHNTVWPAQMSEDGKIVAFTEFDYEGAPRSSGADPIISQIFLKVARYDDSGETPTVSVDLLFVADEIDFRMIEDGSKIYWTYEDLPSIVPGVDDWRER